MQKESDRAEELTEIFSLRLAQPVGEALAQKVRKDNSAVTADMTCREAVAAAIVESAMKGNLAATKYMYQSEKQKADTESAQPFDIQFRVVEA
jgi:hypothetical protein